jgi:diacylglycerol kinase family enzyme
MRRSAAADVARPAAEKRPVRVVTIVNPAAGDGVDRGRLMQIKQALYGPKFAGVYQTLRPGQAEEWARTFRREAGYVVVGGDGTIHEVLTGMDLDRQALSPAGGGRNNALVRDLGGRDLASAAAAAEVGRLIRADVISLILRWGPSARPSAPRSRRSRSPGSRRSSAWTAAARNESG